MSGHHNIRSRLIGLASFIGVALASGAVVADEIKEPADPLELAAFRMLDKHCARCHQEGRLGKDIDKPKRGFGNVLRLDEIASESDRVIPGNAKASLVYNQIVNHKMPYDYWESDGAAGTVPTEDEIKALENWITNGAAKTIINAAACTDRKTISNEDVLGQVVADLTRMTDIRAKGTRYLILTNLYNACVKDDALDVYRQAAIKLVNSLARQSTVIRLDPIDPEKTILRINIDDMGWDSSDWETLLGKYPYRTLPIKQQAVVMDSATGTKLAFIRADWFAFTASRPPLYNQLLKLPKTFQELQAQQRVDVPKNIANFIAKRAGFQKSGVSENNRMIERHPSPSGYFWTSYDFGSNAGRKSFFDFPLGPGGDNGFLPDGGETIFSLPNGFQAYYLNNATGEQLDKGPINIVRDRTHGDRDPTVVNGISCMSCHETGMNTNRDEVRDIVLRSRTFPRSVRDAIEALHPPIEEMNAILAADAKRFKDAMTQAGLQVGLEYGGAEMISALSQRYERELNLQMAAAEFGMTTEAFRNAVADGATGTNRQIVAQLIQAGGVPRDLFEGKFISLNEQITDDRVVEPKGGDSAIKVAKVSTPGIELSLTSDKTVYNQGELATFIITTSKDCFLNIEDFDEKDTMTVLFPNKFSQDNFLKAGTTLQLPNNTTYQYRMKDKGVETVSAVCVDKNIGVDGIKHDFTRSAYTSINNYTGVVADGIKTRGIGVEATKPAASAAPAKPVAADTSKREISRTAIKIRVQ